MNVYWGVIEIADAYWDTYIHYLDISVHEDEIVDYVFANNHDPDDNELYYDLYIPEELGVW